MNSKRRVTLVYQRFACVRVLSYLIFIQVKLDSRIFAYRTRDNLRLVNDVVACSLVRAALRFVFNDHR
jgi:hypothetical protein